MFGFYSPKKIGLRSAIFFLPLAVAFPISKHRQRAPSKHSNRSVQREQRRNSVRDNRKSVNLQLFIAFIHSFASKLSHTFCAHELLTTFSYGIHWFAYIVSIEDEKFIQTTSEFVAENEISLSFFPTQNIHVATHPLSVGFCSFSVGMANNNLKSPTHTKIESERPKWHQILSSLLWYTSTWTLFCVSFERVCLCVCINLVCSVRVWMLTPSILVEMVSLSESVRYC